MGQVILDRNVVIHLLERDKYANFLEKENTHLKEEVRLKQVEIANLQFQIEKHKVDSAAHAAVRQSLNKAITLKDEDIIKQEQAFEKEVRKWKIKFWEAVGVAVAAILAAIAL